MTKDYWAHTHAAADSCPGPGLDGLWPALANTSAANFRLSADNGTYESTLFGDRAVRIIHDHAATRAGTPLFMYLAWHEEHDPHQASRDNIARFDGTVRSDTYKVTAAQIWTMDVQVGRVVDALNATGMLSNAVVSLSSDNGGPLDHANNWPHRGGKHTVYEGGIRTQAFVWASPALMPAAARGTKYGGLMHVADWRATYAEGVVGLTAAEVDDGGAFAAESHNHWASIVGSAAPPRTELIHTVHSPKYYPGNCTMQWWGGRNCAAVITIGDLKLIHGFAGDPRRKRLDEDTGGATVPFGLSGGRCGLAGFDDRCDSPGNTTGKPKPEPDDPDGCLHGCLFNLTADGGESHNLYHDAAHADDVARLSARLEQAGAVAPPWSQAPELAHLTSDELNAQLCAAAKSAAGVVPIDV